MIPGFKNLETHHCVTGSMRHVYELYNYPISEELLFGLGAGIGFVYWHMKGTSPMFGGRANVGRPGEKGLEKVAGERTGVQIDKLITSSNRKAEQAMLDMLAADHPVMMCVDMAYLPYFDFPEGYHFGGHTIVAAGYYPDSKMVLVADRDGVMHEVPLDVLAKARGSKFKPFPPQNAWYTFDFRRKHAPKPEVVLEAIGEVVNGMLNPPIANLGVKGIRTAAKCTQQWPNILTSNELREACFNIYIFIDAIGGTGGGIFRYMYARFLKEAAESLNKPCLIEVSEELHTIGDQWQQVAEIFSDAYNAPDPTKMLPETSSRLMAIADCEQMVWEKLQKMICQP